MITIVGGGPIGCYAASMLSKNNEVTLYEENKEVGLPIQCTGILSDTIHKIIKIKKDYIANKIYSARIYSPKYEHIKINFKRPNIIVYRNKFDQNFRDIALKNGAKIYHESRFVDKNNIKNLKTGKTKKIKYEKIIGADGPLSKVAREFNLPKQAYLQGVQALIKKKNDGIVDFYPHIGTYAWSVPQNDEVLRVGVAAEKNAAKIFRDFAKKYKGKIVGWQGGLIPMHNPTNRTSIGNKAYLVGDAAAQIKNTTGGGLIPGLMCAEELSKSIDQNKDYDKLWKKRIGRKIWAHYFVRKVMNKFTENDWNKLVSTFNKKSMTGILGRESRDEPIKILTKVLIKEPSLMLFLRRLL